MDEVEALLAIAKAIEHLAASVSALGTLAFLFLLFKKMG